MSETKERKWACGCHEVEGQLVGECTQQRPSGELSAAHIANTNPFSPKCFRLAPPVVEVPAPAGDTNPEVPALESQQGPGDPQASNSAAVEAQAPLTDEQAKNLRQNLADVQIIDAPRPE